MANPWDIPTIPEHGDDDVQKTYAAVGYALSQWERLELEIVGMYAALLGVNAPQAIATPAYANARIFRDRATVVQDAAHIFFRRNRDQALEGDFEAYIHEARMLSNRRNDIAHGIVIPSYDMRHPEYERFYLAPAMYRDSRFSPRAAPDYMFTSREMNDFAEAFLNLKARMSRLTSRLRERQRPSP